MQERNLDNHFNWDELDKWFSVSRSGTCHAYLYSGFNQFEIFIDSVGLKIGLVAGGKWLNHERKKIKGAMLNPRDPLFMAARRSIRNL